MPDSLISATNVKNCQYCSAGKCLLNGSVSCQPATPMFNCAYLDKLWTDIQSTDQECCNLNRQLVHAYAEHKNGEPYDHCDAILSKCTEAKLRLESLTDEYSRLTQTL